MPPSMAATSAPPPSKSRWHCPPESRQAIGRSNPRARHPVITDGTPASTGATLRMSLADSTVAVVAFLMVTPGRPPLEERVGHLGEEFAHLVDMPLEPRLAVAFILPRQPCHPQNPDHRTLDTLRLPPAAREHP